MVRDPHRRTAALFGVLTVYIVLQFLWWGVLLIRKDREVARLALELQALGSGPEQPLDAQRSFLMVVGEGSVFLLLLLGVLFLTFRAIRRDLALARTQRNFLLAVTHELRTPIAAIKLQLQTLARKALTEDQKEMLRHRAIEEADRLALLTDKVLLASQAGEGTMELERAPVKVMELLHGVAERARTGAAKGRAVNVTGPEELEVQSDAQALRSVVENLVENAAKYSPEGTAIDLLVETGREGWRLLVCDQGPGIPAGEEERIFEMFYRAGQEETRHTKGTGLGLYIVRRLVQGLGGQVQVRPRQPRGAIFAASFPNR